MTTASSLLFVVLSLVCSIGIELSNASSSFSSPVTVMDANGSFHRRAATTSASSSASGGVVTIITSPGTVDFFSEVLSSTAAGEEVTFCTAMKNGKEVCLFCAPGASLQSTTTSTMKGAAASSYLSHSIVLTGITESDVELGLDDSRHGATLTLLFSTLSDHTQKKHLILALPLQVPKDKIMADLHAIFEAASLGRGQLETFFDVQLLVVNNRDQAHTALDMAMEAAQSHPLAASDTETNPITALSQAYTKLSSSSSSFTTTAATTPSIAAAILSCNDAYARHYRTARAKLSIMQSRISRGLLVDSFGSTASSLLEKTMDLFDRDTMAAAGLVYTRAPSYRLETRHKLQKRLELSIRNLFQLQISNLETITLKRFQAVLLKKHVSKDSDTATALRSAAFAFDTTMSDLEIPSLSLVKSKPCADFMTKLNSALVSFPDSSSAKLALLKRVSTTTSKTKKPTERSVNIGLDFVAMIRPDGFGSYQGFAGYQFGSGNNVIVGVHNDADSPDVISQFGGVRPPFLRVQPKLKLDIEL